MCEEFTNSLLFTAKIFSILEIQEMSSRLRNNIEIKKVFLHSSLLDKKKIKKKKMNAILNIDSVYWEKL